jgi:ABC-type branched-subunit amino acid transport system ATPase component
MSDSQTHSGLVVRDLRVTFGGAVAVDGVSLDAPPGRITGLIGPNGAGKTTTFNACCGLLRPAGGRVDLAGHEVTSASPQHRAQLGLGRTFQRMELFDSLSVEQNVAVGREAVLAGPRPWRHLVSSRQEQRDIATATAEALDLTGIFSLRADPVGSLSTGQRRLVELARVIAAGFRILLLDEPSSGLDSRETDAFGRLLTDLTRERGLGVLLVEHDMKLVMETCAHVYVLDFGKPIFDGDPVSVRASDAVRDAYLGKAA